MKKQYSVFIIWISGALLLHGGFNHDHAHCDPSYCSCSFVTVAASAMLMFDPIDHAAEMHESFFLSASTIEFMFPRDFFKLSFYIFNNFSSTIFILASQLRLRCPRRFLSLFSFSLLSLLPRRLRRSPLSSRNSGAEAGRSGPSPRERFSIVGGRDFAAWPAGLSYFKNQQHHLKRIL